MNPQLEQAIKELNFFILCFIMLHKPFSVLLRKQKKHQLDYSYFGLLRDIFLCIYDLIIHVGREYFLYDFIVQHRSWDGIYNSFIVRL